METTKQGPTMSTTPSWLRKIPNCCESCVAWSKDQMMDHLGRCTSAVSVDSGEQTDSRYRCHSFVRKDGV